MRDPKLVNARNQPFSLELPYAERQRIIVVADQQVDEELQARTTADDERSRQSRFLRLVGKVPHSVSLVLIAHDAYHAVARLQAKGTGVLVVPRREATIINFGSGHPLERLLYVGHPAVPDLYYPLAEFHRRVFEHKFREAVTLLRCLGASHILARRDQGMDALTMGEVSIFRRLIGLGRASGAQSQSSKSNVVFEARFPGNAVASIPDGMVWFRSEVTWQMLAEARIQSGAQSMSLSVTYTDDFGVTSELETELRGAGLRIGGEFQQQRAILWRLEAEFPALGV